MKMLSLIPLMLLAVLSMSACLNLDKQPGMCAKLPMAADGIVRLSKIEVYPEYLDEYMKYATEVGEVSLRTEPGGVDHVCCQRKGESLYGNDSRNLCQSKGLRVTYRIGTFSKVQTGDAAYGQDACLIRPGSTQPCKPNQ